MKKEKYIDKGYDFSKTSRTKKDLYPSTNIKNQINERNRNVNNEKTTQEHIDKIMNTWEVQDYEKFINAKHTMHKIKESFKDLPDIIKREFNNDENLYTETIIYSKINNKEKELKDNISRKIMIRKAEEDKIKRFEEWEKNQINDKPIKKDTPKE